MSSRTLDDPVAERRRLEALEHIRQYGDPVLRTPALPITDFDEALQEDATRMVSIMRDASGVGLAAPQIGSLRRLIVFGDRDGGPVRALCNPRVVWRSNEEDVVEEGCLSLGDELLVEISRPVAVRIEAQDLTGAAVVLEPEGFPARVLQHEIDHLDGMLILDRAAPEQRREALRTLRAQS